MYFSFFLFLSNKSFTSEWNKIRESNWDQWIEAYFENTIFCLIPTIYYHHLASVKEVYATNSAIKKPRRALCQSPMSKSFDKCDLNK